MDRSSLIRAWIASGMTQRAVADRLGIDKQTVFRICKRDGIPTSRVARERQYRAFCRANGVRSLCQLRIEAQRTRAALQGFYGASTPFQLRLLAALREHGEMQSDALAGMLGLKLASVQKSLQRLRRLRCVDRRRVGRHAYLWRWTPTREGDEYG